MSTVQQKMDLAVEYLQQIDGLRESLKDIFKTIKEEHNIPVTVARAVATAISKDNTEEVREKNETIAELLAAYTK